MTRYAAAVEYDGTCYKGWQKQPHAISVQEVVEKAASQVANHSIEIVCAGRTDSGVHAIGQVIHFDSDATRSIDEWRRGMNSHLPEDVAIQWVSVVSSSFHARFSAQRRYYRYIIYNHKVRPPILRSHVSWFYGKLDSDLMQLASASLVGKHDFSSFRASACQSHSAIREIVEISIQRAGNYIYIDISANAFLHHMVRNIAGALMVVGSGEKSPDWIAELLLLKDRNKGAMTAAATGLYFLAVDYPEEFHLPVRSPGLRFDE